MSEVRKREDSAHPNAVCREDVAKELSCGGASIIAHVGVGLGNPRGSPGYDISTAEKSRIALLGVDLILFNSVESAQAFETWLWVLAPTETGHGTRSTSADFH